MTNEDFAGKKALVCRQSATIAWLALPSGRHRYGLRSLGASASGCMFSMRSARVVCGWRITHGLLHTACAPLGRYRHDLHTYTQQRVERVISSKCLRATAPHGMATLRRGCYRHDLHTAGQAGHLNACVQRPSTGRLHSVGGVTGMICIPYQSWVQGGSSPHFRISIRNAIVMPLDIGSLRA